MASQNINSLLGSVKKLNGSNYHDWKFDLGMILWRAGTWKVVSGVTEKPKASQRKELEEWEAAAEDGFSAIGLTIEQSQKPYIRDCTDGPSAWKALKDIYEKNSASNRISLKRRFYSYHHDTTLPITDYINDITSLATQLRAIGLKLEDQEITDVLIYSLSPKYGTIATALMTRSDADFLTVAEISAALMEEEARRKDVGDDRAMMTQDGASMEECSGCHKRGHNIANCWFKQKTCFICDRRGHIAMACPKLKDLKAKAALAKAEPEQTNFGVTDYSLDLPSY